MIRLLTLTSCFLLILLASPHSALARDLAPLLAPLRNPKIDGNTETATTRLTSSFQQFLKYIEQKEYSQAAAIYESLLREHRNDRFAFYALTQLPDRGNRKTEQALELAALVNPQDPVLCRLQGYIAKVGFDDVTAIKHLNKAIQLDATNATAYFVRSKCWRGASLFDRSPDALLGESKADEKQLADINRAIELDATAPQFFLWRGEAKADLNDKDGALADVQSAMLLTQDQCDALVARASIYERLGDYNNTVEDCTAAIATFHQDQLGNAALRHRAIVDYTILNPFLDPEICNCYTKRGRAKLELKDFRGALDDFNAANDLVTHTSTTLLDSRADAHIGLKDYASALKDLIHVKNDHYPLPQNTRLAWVKLQLKDYQGALAEYNLVLKDDGRELDSLSYMWESFTGRGMAKQHLGDFDGAFEDFDFACQAGSYSHLPFLARGSLYLEQKDIAKALVDLEEAVDNAPDDISAHFQRGLAYHAKGQYREAVEDFNVVIRLEPDNASAFFNRGLSERANEKTSDAIASFDTAIKLDPKNQRSFYLRGLTKHDSGDDAAAIADYDSALTLDPKYLNAYIQRAISHTQQNNFKSALADYDAALALDGDSLKAITGKSILLSTCSDASLRDPTAASDLANRALDIDPDDSQSLNARACADAASGNFQSAIALEEKAFKSTSRSNNKDIDGADYAHERITAWKSNQLWTVPAPVK